MSQVVEALYSLGATKTEDLVARNKVRFEGTPEIIELLKELGATDKLLSFIPTPAPLTPPTPVVVAPIAEVPKIAGPFRVICEPSDCSIVINEHLYGSTEAHNRLISTLPPGDATVHVFSNGYESQEQQVLLRQDQPAEVRFRLALTSESRQAKGRQFALDAMHALGGVPTLSLMRDFQGDGTLEWKDDKGAIQQGSMKFTKNIDQDIQLDFKTKDGACTSLKLGKSSKQTCRGSLKNSETLADEAATYLLRYEVQNVIADFLTGTPALVENEAATQIEINTADASDVLTLNENKLPAELVHTRRGTPHPVIKITYSDYVNFSTGQYPIRLQVSVDDNPVFAFALKGISTRVVKKP